MIVSYCNRKKTRLKSVLSPYRDANSPTGNDPRGIGGSGNGKLPFPGERGIFSLFLGFRVGESGE